MSSYANGKQYETMFKSHLKYVVDLNLQELSFYDRG